MGAFQSDLCELPKNIRSLLDIEDEGSRRKALKRYQGMALKGSGLKEHEDYVKVLEDCEIRRIVLSDFGEDPPDAARHGILDTLAENPALPWTFTDIIAHPVRYKHRLDRLLLLKNYGTLKKDAPHLRRVLKVNRIRRLVAQRCGVKADDLKILFPAAASLTDLDLSYNSMGIQEAELIGKFVQEKHLSKLLVRDCRFCGQATNVVVAGFSEDYTVEELDLSGNDIASEAIKVFEKKISRKKLRSLFLEKCRWTEGSIARVLTKFKAKPRLLEKLKVVFKVLSTKVYTSSEEDGASGQHGSDPQQINPTRPYDLTVRRKDNELWVAIDKENKASIRCNLPERIVLEKIPVYLCEKVIHNVKLVCETKPSIVRTGSLNSFYERQLSKRGFSIHRFVLENSTNFQRLEMKVTIHCKDQLVVDEVIYITWPFKKEGGNRVGDIHVQHNYGEVRGGAQCAVAAGCERVQVENRDCDVDFALGEQQFRGSRRTYL